MNRRRLLGGLAAAAALLLASLAHAEAPTPEQLVQKMDEVMTFKTRVTDATLNVTRDGKTDTKTLRIWNRGWDDSYSEFLSPARDKGVKYLKLEKNLYMFLPSTEKVVKISGHLLRQSVMDSDFSYEDMLEQRALLQDYDAKLLGEDKVDGKPCWIVDLTAKNPGQTYARRKMWIAQDTYIPVKAERYAQSGLLLKTLTMSDVTDVGGRKFPLRMVMQDAARKGSQSEFKMANMQFDLALPDDTFSRRRLMKGD
jgi:outer membrane lipoprotein-sorting protein